MPAEPILIDGRWIAAEAQSTFPATDPQTQQPLPEEYPVSSWGDCEKAIQAAAVAAEQLRAVPPEQIAQFLEQYAENIENRADELVAMAHRETALPASPRLAEVELPRTTGQLRQAAAAAREGTWVAATIDTAANIRSCLAPIGPVCVFGPNNFPFAFGSVSGGDFAAAIAAGNPVIGKANTSHPGTTKRFAEAALAALEATDLPRAAVQLLYRTSHGDGRRLVADPRVGATGYTGSRAAGLALKAAADAAGNPIYLELSSVNPVIILPGALAERSEAIADELAASGLLGAGQFCTKPGLVFLVEDDRTRQFVEALVQRFREAEPHVLLSKGVRDSLVKTVQRLREAGAESLTGDGATLDGGFRCANTVLRVAGDRFLSDPSLFQTETFGNCQMLVVCDSIGQLRGIVDQLEGNLTGSIYSDSSGADDAVYETVASGLRQRVGRLLNDKMPTGVAVSPAMNHGGPYPATGHPGFTAVGLPRAMVRFAALDCYDQVRPDRLPIWLQDKNPNGRAWRSIDGVWTQADA